MVTFDGLWRALARRYRGSWERYFKWRRVLWAGLFTVLLTLLLSGSIIPDQVNVAVGEPAPFNIKAPRDFVDSQATERVRREAAEAIPDVHDQDPTIDREIQTGLEEAFDTLVLVRTSVDDGEVERDEALADIPALMGLDPADAPVLLDADDEQISALRSATLELVTAAQAEGIKPDGLDTARDRVSRESASLDILPPWRGMAGRLAVDAIRPNLFFNPDKTEERRAEAMEAVEPVLVARGITLVRDGEPVTEECIQLLRDAGLLRDVAHTQGMLGSALASLMMVALCAAFLRRFRPAIYGNEGHIVLLGLLVLTVLASTRALWQVSGYLAPVAVATMLIALLFDPQVAVFMGVVMGILVGLVSGDEIRYLLVATAGGFTGALAVSGIGHRSDLMRAGFAVSAANAVTILLVHLLSGRFAISGLAMWSDTLVGASNGILCGILTIGTLPYLEGFFGLVTPVKLIELSNPNQPLLRSLLVKAPGTYHHSIMVANLAEAAVEEVGGDSLLARVGAYYHDIGKIRRPYFYIENQMGGENPHTKLAPNLSAIIITAHVKEGVEMAREHRLPEEIVRFISEHHGTSRVAYFYSRAAEESSADDIMEENFRYEGPVPSSKESAVVMLADAAEAAVRSLSRANPDRIEAMVRKIIKNSLFEGQLDQADLSFRDLDRITDVFVKVLTGVFHTRIEYPEDLPPTDGEEAAGEDQGDGE